MSFSNQEEGLRGLKKFLTEAKKILSNNPEDNQEALEGIEEILARLDPALHKMTEGPLDFDASDLLSQGGEMRSRVQGGKKDLWGKPLVSDKSKLEASGPFKSKAHEQKFRSVEELAAKATPPPKEIVNALKDWLLDKWKTPVFWETLDAVEQTWHLQALIRKMMKAGGGTRDVEFINGRNWGSEILGEQRKMSMGFPSVVFAVHETAHLALGIEDEQTAWIATVRLIKDAFKDIDPAYAQTALESEFDNPRANQPKPAAGTKESTTW